MLVCPDRECGHRDLVAKTTNARCPQCRKKLELRGSGEGQIFVCQCGFRKKLAASAGAGRARTSAARIGLSKRNPHYQCRSLN